MEHNMDYGYGLWPIVIGHIAIVLFVLFIIFKPKTKADWKGLGSLSAFFVALFTEMYGFPFSIYLLTSWLGSRYPVMDPLSHEHGHLLYVFLEDVPGISYLVHPGSNILLLIGVIIIAKGWKLIHKGNGQLVTDGIYSRIRHPQYTGFFIVIISFLIQWPTITTIVMAPILFIIYIRLAKKEEKKMIEEFGEEYIEYMNYTNRFLPWPAQTEINHYENM
ncbi:methyltransferase family protein [Natranaerofaba carboxydovora]|uniref:methyltransferase family protein n=1 Tax=Natranaerofaba carboxydovora TaxID=2742683 RepID=UPI001F148E16|nr:isoprenylcysteine carboxylmethyltransferase family protein [Natranaerofaba carboxydovora]UMZ74061.1 Isoprenylcysteine carboxyl methyltransferase (ICMT) family protein [Natranaerofaba carboxydovora]